MKLRWRLSICIRLNRIVCMNLVIRKMTIDDIPGCRQLIKYPSACRGPNARSAYELTDNPVFALVGGGSGRTHRRHDRRMAVGG
jgi:hypothetical protein